MANKDERVDANIEKSQAFAKPILNHLRELIHKACPEIQETMKWSFPHFDLNGTVCSMAGFKEHCAFGFWKASIMSDPDKILDINRENAMGHLGQIKSLKDLPSDKILMAYVKHAAQLNKDGVKLPSKVKNTEKKELVVPDYFSDALKKNKKALNVFNEFPYSHKKEYLEWIIEAKTEDTRNKRMATALEWITDGKSRHWKYKK